MTATIVRRRVAATPFRPASETWKVITKIMNPQDDVTKKILDDIGGVLMSLIAGETFRNFPIIVSGVGAQLRIYCLYGDDAITGEDVNESVLAWQPLDGDWAISLPLPKEDREWIENAVTSVSSRIVVRDLDV